MKLQGGSSFLSSALSISGTGLTLITLSGSDQATVSGGDCTSNSDWTTSSMIIAQPPFTAVTQPGYYGTTITFTATFNP